MLTVAADTLVTELFFKYICKLLYKIRYYILYIFYKIDVDIVTYRRMSIQGRLLLHHGVTGLI